MSVSRTTFAMEMNHPITITVNGAAMTVEAEITLAGLLDQLALAGRPVVIELNQKAVFPRDYHSAQLCDGAQIEVVTLAAGG